MLSERTDRSLNKEVFVFVHGFNVCFEDAARRTAQLAHDLKFQGVPILYSWPSRDRVYLYGVDETNVEWSRPHLKAFLIQLAKQSGAQTINVIAHSMGNRAVAGALKDLGLEQAGAMPTFRHVVLTAPDIDADTFKELAHVLKTTAERITLYSSPSDKALLISKAFHGYPRAGELVTIVPGIDTIDASAVDTSLIRHSYFGRSRSVLSDIFALFKDGSPPSNRFGMTAKLLNGQTYFEFLP